MDHEHELAWLQERVIGLEKALAASHREIIESHARLACISKVVRDDARCMRAPSVSFGAIRIALYAEQPGTAFGNF